MFQINWACSLRGEDFLKALAKQKKRITHGGHVFARSGEKMGIFFIEDLTNIILAKFGSK